MGRCCLHSARSLAATIQFVYRIGHESPRAGFQAIDGCGGSDVKRREVRIAPGEVRRLLWQQNRAQMTPRWVPNPNSSGSGDEKISGQIHFHPVRHAFALATRLLSENASVLQSAAGPKIINPDISLLAVVHVEPAAIR